MNECGAADFVLPPRTPKTAPSTMLRCLLKVEIARLPALVERRLRRLAYQAAHRRLLRECLEKPRPRKLHLGCGTNRLAGWLNTDYMVHPEIFCLDTCHRFPFAADTFDYVFSEHHLEHMPFDVAQRMLAEVLRVLRPAGKIRISTPNLAFLVSLYGNPGAEAARYIEWSHSAWAGVPFPTATFVINNFFRDWGHQFVYDFETLRDSLSRSGFENIVRTEVGQSEDPELKGVEGCWRQIGVIPNRLESLVVEASKPQ